MPRTRRTPSRSIAFTLVELLTVVFIISLLIAILVPSLGAARNAAKKSSSQGAVKAISGALEMFKNDYGKDFPLTNGYPPSFAHPPMTDSNNNPVLSQQEAAQGRFPFHEQKPVVYGAHWLPAMLIGVDAQGYIPKKNVPSDRGDKPWEWYASPQNTQTPIAQRAQMYLDPSNLRMVRTEDLPGQPPSDDSGAINTTILPDWDKMKHLPVIVDAFEQPILYYAASTHGKPTNLVAPKHHDQNPYQDAESGGPQSKGPPYYFHQDNIGFTGDEDNKGWKFASTRPDEHPHPIHRPYPEAGDSPQEIIADEKRDNFATYLIDRKVYKTLRPTENSANIPDTTPLRPVNPDSYILLSPGVDGKWGTTDDIGNVPQWEE